MSRELHPWSRGLAAVLAIGGTFLLEDVTVLAGGYLAVLLPALWVADLGRVHSGFAIRILVPIALVLCLVWGVLVGAPPSLEPGSARAEGWNYALRIVLRLALVGGIAQLCLLTVRPERIAATLHAWGLRGHSLVIAIGGYILMSEIGLRADQIITARFSRGLVPSRSVYQRIRQMPHVLRPLTTWVLRSSLQRSEIWEERQMVYLLERHAQADVALTSWTASVTVICIGLSWFVAGILV